MRQRLTTGTVVAAVLATLACDPVFKLSGSVKTTSGDPVQAVVRVVCDGYAFAETTTRRDGSFIEQRVGSCSGACKLEVLPEAGPALHLPVMKYCVGQPGQLEAKACVHVAADVRLPVEPATEQANRR